MRNEKRGEAEMKLLVLGNGHLGVNMFTLEMYLSERPFGKLTRFTRLLTFHIMLSAPVVENSVQLIRYCANNETDHVCASVSADNPARRMKALKALSRSIIYGHGVRGGA